MKPAAPVTRTFTAPSLSDSPDNPGFPDAQIPDSPDYPDETPSSETDGARDPPDVDHLAAGELETAVRAVRRADDDELGLAEHLVERLERLVDDVVVGAQHLRALELGELPQLVAQRRASVV